MFPALIHLEKQNYMVSGSTSSGQYLKIKAPEKKYNKGGFLSSPQRGIILELVDMFKLPQWLSLKYL